MSLYRIVVRGEPAELVQFEKIAVKKFKAALHQDGNTEQVYAFDERRFADGLRNYVREQTKLRVVITEVADVRVRR